MPESPNTLTERSSKTISMRASARLLMLIGLLVSGGLKAAEPARHESSVSLPVHSPLVPPNNRWDLGPCRQPAKIGDRDFYFAEGGFWWRTDGKLLRQIDQVGLSRRMCPGSIRLDVFDSHERNDVSPSLRSLAQLYLKNRWPVFTVEYCVEKGRPVPSVGTVDAVKDIWMGDGMPEEIIYRLEPVFHYLKTGGKWEGSSMSVVDEKPLIRFMHEDLYPAVEKELPFYRDPKHTWTRKNLRKLCDLYCDAFIRKVGRPVAWGMFLSPYYLACLPETVTVAEKGADAFSNARARGMMVQSGGGKFYAVWRGHEPTEQFAYMDGIPLFANPKREQQGYPLPLMWYYLFRPYLIGANYLSVECMPGSLLQDADGDGQYELSTLGHIAKRLFEFTDRFPDRGIPYAPIALLLDYQRSWPATEYPMGTTYRGFNLRLDDADQMNYGILYDLVFPEHRHTRHTGNYSHTAPYGEIFDILSPNMPGRSIDPKIFEGYKVLFALGGLEIDAAFARQLEDYVRGGGTLVLNVEDLGQLSPALFGVAVGQGERKGSKVRCVLEQREFAEAPFSLRPLQLRGAEALYTCDGLPVVTRHKVGDGYAVLVAPRYMIQSDAVTSYESPASNPQKWKKNPVLQFTADLLDHLTFGVSPIEVLRRDEDKEDLSWLISRKGDGWVVSVFNYSLKREELMSQPIATAKVLAEYPYKAVPFRLTCRAPMQDCVEWYDVRRPSRQKVREHMVVSDTIRGGEIRVYEFQPRRIQPHSFTRYVNFAMRKPVKASSTYSSYPPENAVDGQRNNECFWQSGLDAKGRSFNGLPQWLEVDLGETQTIDHVFVLFHVWPGQTPEMRQRIYKYLVEVSEDGRRWTTVVDERKNELPAHSEGLERWFEPVKARHVRLTVLRNSALSGAQVVEMEVMGDKRETVLIGATNDNGNQANNQE